MLVFLEFSGGQFAGRMGSFTVAGILWVSSKHQVRNRDFYRVLFLFADGQFAGKMDHDIIAGRLRGVCK